MGQARQGRVELERGKLEEGMNYDRREVLGMAGLIKGFVERLFIYPVKA